MKDKPKINDKPLHGRIKSQGFEINSNQRNIKDSIDLNGPVPDIVPLSRKIVLKEESPSVFEEFNKLEKAYTSGSEYRPYSIKTNGMFFHAWHWNDFQKRKKAKSKFLDDTTCLTWLIDSHSESFVKGYWSHQKEWSSLISIDKSDRKFQNIFDAIMNMSGKLSIEQIPGKLSFIDGIDGPLSKFGIGSIEFDNMISEAISAGIFYSCWHIVLLNHREFEKLFRDIGLDQSKLDFDLSKVRPIKWKGTGKELGELFKELIEKGWIEKPENYNSIKLLFTESNSLSQWLKPGTDASTGLNNYEKIYTTKYRAKFNGILPKK